jgi:hypothetical protein
MGKKTFSEVIEHNEPWDQARHELAQRRNHKNFEKSMKSLKYCMLGTRFSSDYAEKYKELIDETMKELMAMVPICRDKRLDYDDIESKNKIE